MTRPIAKYSAGWLPQVPGMRKFQFFAMGRQIKNKATMFATFHKTMSRAMALAHFNMEAVGMSAVYIRRTDSLLKQTVTFHKSAKDRIP